MIKHVKRSLYLLFGVTSLILGVIGIFLPLLPTTPFVLLAAFCFSRSSERLHQWLLNHKYMGKIIREWEMYGVIRTRVKWISTLTMLAMVSYPLIYMVPYIWLKIIVVCSISMVLIFIWSRPSEPAELLGEPPSVSNRDG